MTKVKMLYDDSLATLEADVNDFIKDKKVIDIKFEVSAGSMSHWKYALIIYEEG